MKARLILEIELEAPDVIRLAFAVANEFDSRGYIGQRIEQISRSHGYDGPNRLSIFIVSANRILSKEELEGRREETGADQ